MNFRTSASLNTLISRCWPLVTLPTVDNEHAMHDRLNAEQIAMVPPIVVDQYTFYAPMIVALYTLCLRYRHVAAMRSSKLGADGVIAIEATYGVSANVFRPVDPRNKAPRMIALEPRALDLVRRHRRYLMRRRHPGLKTGLLCPSEAGTRPVGDDQLNDVWREVQVMAGIDRPVTVHGIRHSFHDHAEAFAQSLSEPVEFEREFVQQGSTAYVRCPRNRGQAQFVEEPDAWNEPRGAVAASSCHRRALIGATTFAGPVLALVRVVSSSRSNPL